MLNLCSLGQVVGFDQSITGLLEGGKQVEGLLESEMDPGRGFLVGRMILHDPSLSLRCVGPLRGPKSPVALGTGTCGSVLRHRVVVGWMQRYDALDRYSSTASTGARAIPSTIT